MNRWFSWLVQYIGYNTIESKTETDGWGYQFAIIKRLDLGYLIQSEDKHLRNLVIFIKTSTKNENNLKLLLSWVTYTKRWVYSQHIF